MEDNVLNNDIDDKELLKKLAKERKSIINDIFKLRDIVLEECDKVLAKQCKD